MRNENCKNAESIIPKALLKGLVPRTLSYHLPPIPIRLLIFSLIPIKTNSAKKRWKMGLWYRFDFFLIKNMNLEQRSSSWKYIWTKNCRHSRDEHLWPHNVFLWNETFPYLKAIQKLNNHIFEKNLICSNLEITLNKDALLT